MPKKWRRDERRRIAQAEEKAHPRFVPDGHPAWASIVAACSSNEDTTIATSTESVTINAGVALDLPVHVSSNTAVVHYAFKVNEMDIDVSATCTTSNDESGQAVTTKTKTVLDTVSMNADTGWLRGTFTPAMKCTCVFQLSNEYSFFNSKEVLFEIKVRDDVQLMAQWRAKMDSFVQVLGNVQRQRKEQHEAQREASASAGNASKASSGAGETTLMLTAKPTDTLFLEQLKGLQIQLEELVCDGGSACLRPETRAEMLVTRSCLELEKFMHEISTASKDEEDAVAKYLHSVHFMPSKNHQWWIAFQTRMLEDRTSLKIKAIQGMSRRKPSKTPSNKEKNQDDGSKRIVMADHSCTPERIISFLTARQVFGSPNEHVAAALSQRVVAAVLSSSSASSSSSTTSSSSSTTSSYSTTHSHMLPIHVEIFKRIAPSSSSLASLLRTYESLLCLLKEEDLENHNDQLMVDFSLLHGQILYLFQVLADLSFDPTGKNDMHEMMEFRTSVQLLRYVACVVCTWSNNASSSDVVDGDAMSSFDADDWREKVKVLLLQTFNIDDALLVQSVASTLKTRVDLYCAHPVCVQLEQCMIRAGESCAVWQRDIRNKCFSVLCMLLDRPSAGIPSVLLLKCSGDVSMLMGQ